MKVKRRDIIDLIVSADDYGHRSDVLFSWFRDILKTPITAEEVKEACTPPYGEEDYEAWIGITEDFNERYFKVKGEATNSTP